jgi:tRNA (mo5U34)-methyltransferase
MIDYSEFFTYLKTTELKDVSGEFAERTQSALDAMSHGDFERWAEAIEAMGDVVPSEVDLGAQAVRIGDGGDLSAVEQDELRRHLMELHPWRKGPFEVFGIHIDTEWRSDLKWARLQNQIDLKNKLVLDVGCGNGYYLFRMLAAEAKAVVGVDPFLLYVMQFHAINRFVQTDAAAVLPLGVEGVPEQCKCFDTVFSMGILYHRRDPMEHIEQLKGFLKPGGELVLETIVLETEAEEFLTPEGRYGKMRNVWTIASVSLLEKWLVECGFENVRVVDVAKTTFAEQRKTDWMTFESLSDFLDPEDDTKTIEGHPAPVRAVLVATKK